MGLNDIQLNATTTVALYPFSLVDAGDVIPQKNDVLITPAQSAWKYLGNNDRNILLVVSYDHVIHLPDEALNFLTNILSACKLSLGDVVILNRQNHLHAAYKETLDHFGSKSILLFGTDPADFGMPVTFPHFQVQSLAGNQFLYAPSLEECREDKLMKSKLWVSLQKMFTIV